MLAGHWVYERTSRHHNHPPSPAARGREADLFTLDGVVNPAGYVWDQGLNGELQQENGVLDTEHDDVLRRGRGSGQVK